jgi:hypothetical protein
VAGRLQNPPAAGPVAEVLGASWEQPGTRSMRRPSGRTEDAAGANARRATTFRSSPAERDLRGYDLRRALVRAALRAAAERPLMRFVATALRAAADR